MDVATSYVGRPKRSPVVDRVKGFASRGYRGRHRAMFYVYLLHSTKDNRFTSVTRQT